MQSAMVNRFALRRFLSLLKKLRDPRSPGLAKALPLIALLYAVLPFDVIPDMLPILGQMDDALIVSLFFFLALRMVAKVFPDRHSFSTPSTP